MSCVVGKLSCVIETSPGTPTTPVGRDLSRDDTDVSEQTNIEQNILTPNRGSICALPSKSLLFPLPSSIHKELVDDTLFVVGPVTWTDTQCIEENRHRHLRFPSLIKSSTNVHPTRQIHCHVQTALRS